MPSSNQGIASLAQALLAASRSRSSWNDRFEHWERPASETEDDRPTFKLLWEPPRRRQADVVLTRHYDRFARSARAMRAERTALTFFSVEIGQGAALKRSQQLS